MNPHDATGFTDAQPERSLAITMSGGGHRATLFGLGALMYLADARVNRHVTSIASVSGGSLTNGFVGQNLDFRTTGGQDFRERVAKPLARQIAKSGTLFAPLLTKVYLAILIVVGLAVLAGTAAIPMPCWARFPAFVVGLMVWGWLFGWRGLVCALAFRKTLFSPSGRTTPLSAVKKDELDHVICATELRASQQVFFSGDFVYSFMLGHGRPADLPLDRAVQASACFPGGFPPARLSTRPHDFTGAPPHGQSPPKPPSQMVMSDGGVYDNMGDEWARGFNDRLKRWRELGEGRLAPNQLVVVNSSARVPWNPLKGSLIPLFGEIISLLRVNSVMYINTTNVRRQNIVSSYDPNDPQLASELPGALVQISQSPFVVAEFYARTSGPASSRAKEVIAMLGEQTRKQWTEIAEQNSKVATTLCKLGVEVSSRLLFHSYVLTMCNLYVIFGDEFPLLPDEIDLKRFRDLIS